MAVKGHHFPNQCYVEFAEKNDGSEHISLELVHQEIEKHIEQDLLINKDQITGDKLYELCPHITYRLPKDQPIRVIRIGEFPFSPCGGTHVNSLKELKGLKITNHKIKKSNLKIYYEIQEI